MEGGEIMIRAVIDDGAGQIVQVVNFTQKKFSTGSRGYQGNGQATIDGKEHNVNFLLVEKGSKPKATK